MFSKVEVHNQLAATFLRLSSWHLAVKSVPLSERNDTFIWVDGRLLFDRGKRFDSKLWSSHSKSWNCPSTSQVVYTTTQVFTNLPPVLKLWVPQKREFVSNHEAQDVIYKGSAPSSLVVKIVVFSSLSVCPQMRLLRAEVCEPSQASLWIAAKCSVLNKLFEVQGVDNLCSATTYTLKTIVTGSTYGGIRLAVVGLNVLTRELYNLRDKCLLVAIQIPKVLAWLDYVQWKFKLLSTGWWSVKNESLVEIQLPIMKFSDATVVQKNNREDLMVFSNLSQQAYGAWKRVVVLYGLVLSYLVHLVT